MQPHITTKAAAAYHREGSSRFSRVVRRRGGAPSGLFFPCGTEGFACKRMIRLGLVARAGFNAAGRGVDFHRPAEAAVLVICCSRLSRWSEIQSNTLLANKTNDR